MKKLLALFIGLALVLTCFAGCKYGEAEIYQTFADKHKSGMTKQEVIDELGCPDSYIDAERKHKTLDSGDHESFKAHLSEDTSVVWYYSCYVRLDSINFYTLIIDFDSEGKTISATMTPTFQ